MSNPQKKNGFTQHPHVFQIISYIIYSVITFFDLFIFIQLLSEKVTFYIIYTLVGSITISSSMHCTLHDPTDKVVLMQHKMKIEKYCFSLEYSPQSSFDFQLHELELYCDYCEAYVQQSSKHCRKCNRCTEGFDHHCVWINNCIGTGNYKSFMVMINAFMVQFALSIAIHSHVIYGYLNDELNASIMSFPDQDLKTKYILCIILLIPSVVAVFALVQLIVFHIFIIYKGITTYAFILQDRAPPIVVQFLHQLRKIQRQSRVVPYPTATPNSNNQTLVIENNANRTQHNQSQQQYQAEYQESVADHAEEQVIQSYSLDLLFHQELKNGHSSQGQLTNFDIEKTPHRETFQPQKSIDQDLQFEYPLDSDQFINVLKIESLNDNDLKKVNQIQIEKKIGSFSEQASPQNRSKLNFSFDQKTMNQEHDISKTKMIFRSVLLDLPKNNEFN